MKNEFNKDRSALIRTFENPGPEYRGKPFWSWNGELEKDELIRQAKVMKEMGLGGFFMHARSGLITEYLGDEWFDLTNAVADAAEEIDMEAWLYDEDRWPSGSAGGKATADPQYRMKSLVMFDMPVCDFVWDDDTLCAFWAKVEGINLLDYGQLKQGEQLPSGDGLRVLRFAIVPDPCSNNYNGNTYLDTMSLKATEHFINLTHEEYKKRCGDRLGQNIQGIFTDEPHRGHGLDDFKEENGVRRCSMAWTDDLFEEFEKRYGYDPVPLLPEVFYRLHGEKVSRIRIHYFDLANNLFLERFAKPIHEWCLKNNMRFTGHVLHEDALSNQSVAHGSLMRFYEHMDDPGVDVLSDGDQLYWIVKQLTSAARQLGKKWLLSELYGCTGWQMSFNDYKAVGDWQAFFGINLRCPHLSWYTMEGEAKRDYPASILHQSAWYKDFARLETYFARFGMVISEGDPICDVLVFNPIESAWALAYAGWSKWLFATDPDVLGLEKHYADLFHMLAGHHIDFDYGEEQMMASDWEVGTDKRGAYLRIGLARYRSVVISGAVTMRPSSVEMFRSFLAAGGRVVFAGDLPGYVDGLPSAEPAKLAQLPGACIVPFDGEALAAALEASATLPIRILNEKSMPNSEIFCQNRRCEASGLSFAVMLNMNREKGFKDAVIDTSAYKGQQVQLWDMMTGERKDLGIAKDSMVLSFEAGQERVLAFTEIADELPAPGCHKPVETAVLVGPVAYSLDEPNVLVLDFARWRWEGGQWHEAQEILKADRRVRDDLGIEHRGGEMLQPWFAKLYANDEYGKIELSYSFTADALPQGELFLTCERPENWTVMLNGTELTHDPADGFWVDICFKRLRIPAELIRLGENEVRMVGSFRRTTNLEALHLTGTFGVKLKNGTPVLCDLPRSVSLGNLADNGLPFYSGRVDYHFDLPSMAGKTVSVALGDLHGSLALVHGKEGEKAIMTAPYSAQVTVPDDGNLTITLICTRRNTFGPLHLTPVLAKSYGPSSFVTTGSRWTDDYALVDCRLGEDITVTVIE